MPHTGLYSLASMPKIQNYHDSGNRQNKRVCRYRQSGVVLRGDKDPVDKTRQGKIRLVLPHQNSYSGIRNISACGRRDVPGTAAGRFTVIGIMGKRAFAGNIRDNKALRGIFQERFARVAKTESRQREIGKDKYGGNYFHKPGSKKQSFNKRHQQGNPTPKGSPVQVSCY
jgi:hypothetical protein